VKEMLEESPVFDKREISVIHNGIDTDKFAPIPPDPKIRKEFGISDADLVIGLVGRLDWDKGHRYLFEAAAPLINGEFANIKIIALGFGKELERLKRLCEQLHILRNVIFAGQRNDIKEIISIFDVGVQPSIAVDTSSYSMKEIMAMQKPVVCSSYGGLKEIAEDGVTGYVVPPRDSDSLRERIAELCRSGEVRERMGKAGRRRVEQEFSAQVSVQKTLEVYRRAIEGFRK
jgi:glycosyltransferase involved in cell wall biosynthesis